MQREFKFPDVEPAVRERDCKFLLAQLEGQGWLTAAEILKRANIPNTESQRRWVRAVAAGSGGRVAGGQLGYKLIKDMTIEEYNHYRNWMMHQARQMQQRIIQGEKVFYARKSLKPEAV